MNRHKVGGLLGILRGLGIRSFASILLVKESGSMAGLFEGPLLYISQKFQFEAALEVKRQ